MLDVHDVSHVYGDRTALDHVTLHTTAARIGLIGVNGAGKSTLLALLSGAQRPTEGTVTIDGANPYVRGERRRAIRDIALMPQDFAFHPRMTALEFVTYVGWLRGMSWARARRGATDAIARVNLADRAKHRMGSLSGGMVRRVGLAQALVSDPKVLLLDEPTTGLDPEQRSIMLELITDLPNDVQVLMSSHVMEDLEQAARELVVLHDGVVLHHGSVDDLRELAPVDSRSPLQDGFLSLLVHHRAKVAS